jgi:hypothetical protein
MSVDLGLLVQRPRDPLGAVGVIVGVVVRPSRLALVGRRNNCSTFERPASLVEVHAIQLSPALPWGSIGGMRHTTSPKAWTPVTRQH